MQVHSKVVWQDPFRDLLWSCKVHKEVLLSEEERLERTLLLSLMGHLCSPLPHRLQVGDAVYAERLIESN